MDVSEENSLSESDDDSYDVSSRGRTGVNNRS